MEREREFRAQASALDFHPGRKTTFEVCLALASLLVESIRSRLAQPPQDRVGFQDQLVGHVGNRDPLYLVRRNLHLPPQSLSNDLGRPEE